MKLSLNHIEHSSEGKKILQDIQLTLEPGVLHTLLGSANSGRSTLLRVMAGLERPSSGQVTFNNRIITHLPINHKDRRVALVYEEFINYPHFTVFENLASPLKMQKIASQKEIAERVQEMARLLKLTPFLHRLPSQLSGGQQQRTSLARALIKEVDLLLMDNPLANLDYKLREELRSELKEILKKRNSIVIFGTSDPLEALILGGKTIVLKEGKILQHDNAIQVYQKPLSDEVALMVSDPPMNLLQGKVQNRFLSLGPHFKIPIPDHFQDLPEGDYQIGIRPQHFSLQDSSQGDDPFFSCHVSMVEMNGSDSFIHLHWQNERKKMIWERMGIHPMPIGTTVQMTILPHKLFAFSLDGRLLCWPIGQ